MPSTTTLDSLWISGAGSDLIDGGTGIDMAVYLGDASDYEAALTPNTEAGAAAGAHDALIRNKLTGAVDTVRNVELFKIGADVYTVPAGQPQPADNVYVELVGYVQPVIDAQLAGTSWNTGWLM